MSKNGVMIGKSSFKTPGTVSRKEKSIVSHYINGKGQYFSVSEFFTMKEKTITALESKNIIYECECAERASFRGKVVDIPSIPVSALESIALGKIMISLHNIRRNVGKKMNRKQQEKIGKIIDAINKELVFRRKSSSSEAERAICSFYLLRPLSKSEEQAVILLSTQEELIKVREAFIDYLWIKHTILNGDDWQPSSRMNKYKSKENHNQKKYEIAEKEDQFFKLLNEVVYKVVKLK